MSKPNYAASTKRSNLAALLATCAVVSVAASTAEATVFLAPHGQVASASKGGGTTGSKGGTGSTGSAGSTTSSAPSQASAVGYNDLTFSTTSFASSNVDMKLTGASGYQWYFFNFFGATPSTALTTLNSDGSVTLASFANATADAGITSATQISTAPYYRGTAFGGGGYFEATLAFNAATVNTTYGWPSWWTMSIEHLVGLAGQQWPGQAQYYMHFVEPDIFEADTESWAGANTYGGDTHDWYGEYSSSSCPYYCNIDLGANVFVRTVPTGTNFNQYHKYGLLWVPATSTKKGSLTYYFDGKQVGATTSYSQYTSQPPVPTATTPWTFGIVDQQHLVLMLGTGPSTPMQVQSVNVWQASSASNMHN